MNTIKSFLGILWMITGPAAIFFLVMSAFDNINSAGKGDITNPIPWIIIIAIFIPIAIGFSIFGWYALKGLYSDQDFIDESIEGSTKEISNT